MRSMRWEPEICQSWRGNLDAKLVHVSTDYVFDGSKQRPYVEDDPAIPLNVYGNTKLAGEAVHQGTAEKYFIVRTSALYGNNPCRAKGGRNFVDLMLKLASERDELRVVDDEIVSPTSTAELAKQIALSKPDRPLRPVSRYGGRQLQLV